MLNLCECDSKTPSAVGAPHIWSFIAPICSGRCSTPFAPSGVELTLGATVLDFADDGARVSVGMACGATRIRDEADLLIGADGLRSQRSPPIRLWSSGSASILPDASLIAQLSTPTTQTLIG